MPVCPSCSAEIEAGATICAACGAVLAGATPAVEVADPSWVQVYTGTGVALRMVQDELERLGIPVASGHSDIIGEPDVLGALAVPDVMHYTLAVPPDVYTERREEIDGVVGAASATEPVDPAAVAEAEEDYNIQACPSCLRYFHQPPPTCPGSGEPLVPAVECFTEGQTAPERVVVRWGPQPEMEALQATLTAAGFEAVVDTLWGPERASVEVAWHQVADRTRELDSLVSGE